MEECLVCGKPAVVEVCDSCYFVLKRKYGVNNRAEIIDWYRELRERKGGDLHE